MSKATFWRHQAYGATSARQTTIEFVDSYAGRVPTIEELRKDTGMSRAEAYRWRSAFIEARPHLTAPSIAPNLPA